MNRPNSLSKTQRDSIKQFLLSGSSLTPLEALSLFGAYRLAAHIEVLRSRGMFIVTTMNRDATGRSYARYHIPVEHCRAHVMIHQFMQKELAYHA
jgi:hypothetical protein